MSKFICSLSLALCCLLSQAADSTHSEQFRKLMGDGWKFLREKPQSWRTTPAALEIRLEPGNMWGPANDARNVLVRELPDPQKNQVQISMVVSNRPSEQYEQMDLVWYYDDSHMVKIGQERVDGRLSIVMGREEADKTRTIIIIPVDLYTVELRLTCARNEIVGEFRARGAATWTKAGQCDLPIHGQPHASIQCYQGPAKLEHWGRITNFTLSSNPLSP